jgi:uncharacterized protein DUF1592/uncharacterized protein DUF1588/uncharacterized protein DUF1595/uncharacterized protein DUF1587/uncharacterized protein DUF1585
MRWRVPKRATAGHDASRAARAWLLLGALAASACSGVVSPDEAPARRPDGAAPEGVDDATIADVPAPSSRFARLTHAQWENSVRDLLRLDAVSGLSSTFPADARTAGFLFDNHTLSLEVDQVLASAYASAAESLAARVTSDPAALARLLPPDTGDERERARAFIENFGERAFRRPLAPDEVVTFASLFELGRNAYDDASGFAAGIRMLVETFLRSPYFEYRVESSTDARGATIPLSDYEVAQRLSYLFTNSTPDDTLLGAAHDGQLSQPSDVRRQAMRLLSTPGAREAVVGFHDQLLDFAKYQNISPSPRAFPDVPDNFADEVIASGKLFLENLVVAQAGNFKALMTSNEAFVNADLARVYGVSGDFGSELVKVTLPESQRRGIFNQLGFLAANSTSVNPDPIHRGVFIATRVLCVGIAAPPDGVPPLPPITDGTNRQVVEKHTQSSPVCQACHAQLINPFGFPFENYDASGAFRTTDNGEPVDASTTAIIDGEPREIHDSIELAEVLGDSRQAHECFTSHLVEYAFGRSKDPLDQELVSALTEASLGGAPILELMVRIAESPAFLTRSAQELP